MSRQHHITSRLKFFALCATLAAGLAIGCGRNNAAQVSADPPINAGKNPIDPGNQIPSVLGSASGSASSGGLSSTGKTAFQNLANQQSEVNPTDTSSSEVMAALEAQARQLLQMQGQGKDVGPQKIALAQQMMTECGKLIAVLTPKPGQPLVGQWAGRGCKKTGGGEGAIVSFTITPGDAVSEAQGRYVVRGGTNGQGGAKAEGNMTIAAQPWQGELSDRPSPGGVLNDPKYNKNEAGYGSCAMGVVLQRSGNPIPENHIEAMRRAGQCFRRALFFTSSVSDGLFKSMDPTLAAILQSKMLGLNGSAGASSASPGSNGFRYIK